MRAGFFALTLAVICLCLSLAFASHSVNIAVSTDGSSLWTKSGERELFNFSLLNTGSDSIIKINITVPHNPSGLNYTAEANTITTNNANWSCSTYNLSGNPENIVCINASIGGLSAQINISFYATAFSTNTEYYSSWNITTTDSTGYNVSTAVLTGIDGIVPSINVTSLVNGGNVSGLLNVTINATDAGSGINATAVRFRLGDATGWINLSLLSGSIYYNRTYDTNNIADGMYNITINASDSSGNSAQVTVNDTKINNTISHALVTVKDSTAYVGASDNDWKFEFNVTMPNSCRLKIRLENWTTAYGNVTYNISVEGNALWKYISGGATYNYSVKNNYDDSQVIYMANDTDGVNDEKMLATFNLTVFIPSGTIGATNWRTNYYLKCQ